MGTDALSVGAVCAEKAEREEQKAKAESLGDAHGDDAAAGRRARKGKRGVLRSLLNILEV